MENARKMALVDPALLDKYRMYPATEATRNNDEEYVSPTSSSRARELLLSVKQPAAISMAHLDADMKEILEKKDLGEEDKAKLYGNVLQRYLEMKKQSAAAASSGLRPAVNAIARKEEEEEEPQQKKKKEEEQSEETVAEDVLKSVPSKYREKAALLMDKIRRRSDVMGWDSDGRLVYKGKTVPHTNIEDLVNDVMRKRRQFEPVGWETFASGLKEMNVPTDLIGHKERAKYMESSTFATSPKMAAVFPRSSQGRWEVY